MPYSSCFGRGELKDISCMLLAHNLEFSSDRIFSWKICSAIPSLIFGILTFLFLKFDTLKYAVPPFYGLKAHFRRK